MKKTLVILTFICSFLIVDATFINSQINRKNDTNNNMRFIYISYLEYLSNFQGNSITINKSKINKMIDNIVLYNFNTIILHVSPFSDAIYNSKIFPYSYTLTGEEGKNPGFDYLEYFIKVAHTKKVKVHAWINPYRVSFKNDWEKLAKKNPAHAFANTENIGVSDKGIYYDPTSELVKDLIIEQVSELIDNYAIDGIHFDDYFYIDYNIDNLEYQNYLTNKGDLSLKEYRLMHTNDLIKRVGSLIKKYNKEIVFSIAPDGNINNNYNYHYADVKTWIQNEYIDIIMPQIYYGFNNQYLPFDNAYNSWYKIISDSNSKVKIIPTLAFYKVGMVDNGAGSGKNEWLDDGVIKKQISYLREKEEYSGFGLFRYDFLFNNDFNNNVIKKELFNIRKIM